MDWNEFRENVFGFVNRFPVFGSSSNRLWMEEAEKIEELALNQREFGRSDEVVEVAKVLLGADTQQQFLKNAHDMGIGFTAGQILQVFGVTPGKYKPSPRKHLEDFLYDDFYNMLWDTIEYCLSPQAIEISLDYIPFPTREQVREARDARKKK